VRQLAAIDPRTGCQDGTFAAFDAEDLVPVAARLRAAAPAWQALTVDARIEVLAAWARDAARDPALLAALIADTGRSHVSMLECAGLPTMVGRWADWARDALTPPTPRSAISMPITIEQQYVPFDLVGFITPWNSPLGLSFIDAIPALAAGCTALIKPSEVTPRFIAPLLDTLSRHPRLAEVVSVVAGDGLTGIAVVDLVDAVCFTGSVPTGRKVAVQCAGRLIPTFLELGGKDAAIVLAGADLDRAVAGILWSGNMNTGQTCHSVERVFVHQSLFDAFIERMVRAAEAVTLAQPRPEDGQLGPFIRAEQAAVVSDQLADATAAGAAIVTGGAPFRDGGWWMRPTVVTQATPSMRLMREESFAPLLPVVPFDDADTAIAMANDSIYGLSASVWGPPGDARAVASRLRAGGVSINDISLPSVVQDGDKMAFNQSGLGGSRMGQNAIRRFVRSKALLTNASSEFSPWWVI